MSEKYVKREELLDAIRLIVDRLNPFLDWINKQQEKAEVPVTMTPAPTPTLVEPHDFIGDMNAVFIANPVIMSMLSPEIQSAVRKSFARERRLIEPRERLLAHARLIHRGSLNDNPACKHGDCDICQALRTLRDEEAK